MLQVHKQWRMNYKKQEALWKQSISSSHKIFCSCGDYRNHFKPCQSFGDGGGGDDGVSLAEGISFITEDTGGTPEGEDSTAAKELTR
ncbi:ORF2 [Grizzly bear anellovirus 2]|nr:ORF2 [Grizzly bear anellovirus 2]